MPTYTYRREDGTTFEIKQKFTDDPLEVDPATGQQVHRVPQASGIIFKGSGFYVTDARGGSSAAVPSTGENGKASSSENGTSTQNGNGNGKAESKASTDTKTETKSESKSTAKAT